MQQAGEGGRLGERLVRAGALSEPALREGLAQQRVGEERLGECLRRLGLVDEETLLRALAGQLTLRFAEFNGERPDRATQHALPVDYVRRRQILPLALRDGVLEIATSDPGNRSLIEDLRLLSGCEIEEVVAPASDIAERIAEHYQVTVESLIEDLPGGADGAGVAENLHDIEVMASEPTVINLVNLIISRAVQERASDIHLVPFEGRLELRYRIDGVLQEMPPPPRHLHAALVSRVKIMAEMNIAERFVPQDGRIQIQHSGRRVDIRVGTMPTIYGESLVMRLLEKGGRIQTMEELGLDHERAVRLHHAVEKPHGIFLATGPTGSGKTTSLYSILSSIYTVEKKILTIEDPVEYELPGVAQIPVRPSRGFTFATGLRAILRQDPDVVMVGEIRDTETAEIAVRAALTGHLVFSTLHTNDAAGAVTRLVDMGIEPFLIASTLEGVLAQRLLRCLCPDCAAPTPVDEETRVRFQVQGVTLDRDVYSGAVGCEACRNTGYRGRTGLYELLVFDARLRELVTRRCTSGEIKHAVAGEMVTVRDDGLRKAAAGKTSLSEVLRVAVDDSDEKR